jgi:5-methyltetrahydropteroyltriglutamate--homocysteine methyltransferase
MPEATRPPFRADHVGSLLRPEKLKLARDQAKNGKITAAELKALEDRCIKHVVALQESAGIQSVTDGEYRRAMWHTDFLLGFDGVTPTHSNYALNFEGEGGATGSTSSMLVVTGKIRRSKPIMVDHLAYLKSVTKKTAKFCMPAATYMHMRGGRNIVDKKAYPDMDEFWADVATAYQAEIADLGKAGLTYLQIDDVSFCCLCDPKFHKQIANDGEDPDKLPAKYSQVINSLIAKRPKSMAVTVHTCRGNHDSMWMASGGYDPIAEATFGGLDVDGFFLEYDTERSGGFEPLRYVTKGKKVVLGLVSSKKPQLESKDVLKRRIDEAAKYVPLEYLCLSPQCGFASTQFGNLVTEDDEKRKLELIVQVATEVWGTPN